MHSALLVLAAAVWAVLSLWITAKFLHGKSRSVCCGVEVLLPKAFSYLLRGKESSFKVILWL